MATSPAVGQHKLELVLLLVRVVVNFEGEVGNFFCQLLEVVGQLGAVFDDYVAVLSVGEVILKLGKIVIIKTRPELVGSLTRGF